MSHFFKALEQADQDRAAQGLRPRDAARVEPTGEPAPPPPAAEPRGGLLEAGPAPAPSPDGVDPHLVSLLAPTASEADQYRVLRHTVEHLRKTSGVSVIAVSSPGVGDGKTITAINLAGALAQAEDASVLLIDLDLRRPSVASRLGLSASGPGVVDAILDPALAVERVARARPPFNLAVLTAGRPTSAPYELLKAPRFGELLDEARARWDYIVLDTPPVVPFPDFRVIARWLDGYFLVVAAHKTPRPLLEDALDVVEPGKLLGLVFNGDDRPLLSYYGHAYGVRASGHEPTRTSRRPGLAGRLARWRAPRAGGAAAQ